jgi:hypothetical protein
MSTQGSSVLATLGYRIQSRWDWWVWRGVFLGRCPRLGVEVAPLGLGATAPPLGRDTATSEGGTTVIDRRYII